MIDFDSRYFNNAHRISDGKLAATVTTLHDGQWLMRDENNEFVIHDGTSGVKGYITISSKYGTPADNIGRPITQGPSGRDNVTSTGRVSVLIGPFRLATDQYETGVYTNGTPLVISQNGKLTPATLTGATPSAAWDIVAYVYSAPVEAGAPMIIVHE